METVLLLGRWKMDDKAMERRLRCPKFWILFPNPEVFAWTRTCCAVHGLGRCDRWHATANCLYLG